VTFDADGQHQMADIPALLAPLMAGDADVALGSRFLGDAPDMPKLRRVMLKSAIALSRWINRYEFTDTHNGFRAFTATAAARIDITQDRMAHASEMLHQIVREKLRYTEVPVTIHYSAYSLAKGQSTMNALGILVELLSGRVIK